MSSYAELTDRGAVEKALEECDRLGRHSFLQKYGYGEAREYFLVTDTGRYDSKAIFGAAYGYQFGTPLGADEISGGRSGAAGRLADLGFVIEGIDNTSGRQTFDSFEAALLKFSIPLENHAMIRDFLRKRDDEQFYIPASGTYIAAVPAQGRTKAFIHSGFIWHRLPDGTGETIELPVNRIRNGGDSRSTRRDRAAQTCPDCTMVLPASGVCQYC